MSVLWGELVLGVAIVVLLAWAVVLQRRGEARARRGPDGDAGAPREGGGAGRGSRVAPPAAAVTRR